jgi:hypothetical protein
MNVSSLGEVMNEALYRPPLLCRVLEDGYGRRCGFSWIGGLIVSKLELEPPMSGSSLLMYHALRKPSFVGCRYEERRGFSFLMGGLIVLTTPIFGLSY